ncbi:hypothetical protein EB796_005870 [Bugula neritina]|uniref:Uncharacterized protein n=1 Tax=Bugula neritina TaxID=10212 RepID=A0A7J7KAZ3_BUGNE|nr:hypothetical protein EB796_005870 [Bugula neritina]
MDGPLSVGARRKWKKFVTMLVCRKSSSISLARIQHGEGLLCQACSAAKRVILLAQFRVNKQQYFLLW